MARLQIMKVFRALAASALFLALLLLTYYIHIRFFSVNVVFYAAIADSIIAALVTGVLITASRSFNAFEKLQLVVIWLLAGYCFSISVPTVIDRSLSLYILEKIEQRGGGIQRDHLPDVFTKEYLKEDRLVAHRTDGVWHHRDTERLRQAHAQRQADRFCQPLFPAELPSQETPAHGRILFRSDRSVSQQRADRILQVPVSQGNPTLSLIGSAVQMPRIH
jgi:hypothetical protein